MAGVSGKKDVLKKINNSITDLKPEESVDLTQVFEEKLDASSLSLALLDIKINFKDVRDVSKIYRVTTLDLGEAYWNQTFRVDLEKYGFAKSDLLTWLKAFKNTDFGHYSYEMKKKLKSTTGTHFHLNGAEFLHAPKSNVPNDTEIDIRSYRFYMKNNIRISKKMFYKFHAEILNEMQTKMLRDYKREKEQSELYEKYGEDRFFLPRPTVFLPQGYFYKDRMYRAHDNVYLMPDPISKTVPPLVQKLFKLKTREEMDVLKMSCNYAQIFLERFQERVCFFCDVIKHVNVFEIPEDLIRGTQTFFQLADHEGLHVPDESQPLFEEQDDAMKIGTQMPLVFLRRKHATLVLATGENSHVCYLMQAERGNKGTFKSQAMRVDQKPPFVPPIVESVSIKNEEAGVVHIEIKCSVEEEEIIQTYTCNRIPLRVPKVSSIQSILTPLVRPDTLEEGLFEGAVFSEHCVEALPVPIWHRLRKFSRSERIFSWAGSFLENKRSMAHAKSPIPDNDLELGDLYALKPPRGDTFNLDELIFHCFSMEHEVQNFSSSHVLELVYTTNQTQEPLPERDTLHRGTGPVLPEKDEYFSHSQIFNYDRLAPKKRTLVADCFTNPDGSSRGWVFKNPVAGIEDVPKGKTRRGSEGEYAVVPGHVYARLIQWACHRFSDGTLVPSMTQSVQENILNFIQRIAERVHPEQARDVAKDLTILWKGRQSYTYTISKYDFRLTVGFELECVRAEYILHFAHIQLACWNLGVVSDGDRLRKDIEALTEKDLDDMTLEKLTAQFRSKDLDTIRHARAIFVIGVVMELYGLKKIPPMGLVDTFIFNLHSLEFCEKQVKKAETTVSKLEEALGSNFEDLRKTVRFQALARLADMIAKV